MIAGIINWLWIGFPLIVNTSGNSTIPTNEISAQTVPTMLNGITTSTGIIIAFTIAISGFLIGYILKDDKRDRDVIIVILATIPFPMLFQFFAYLTLAGGQGVFEIALRLGFVSLLYSLFALMSLFAFLSFRLYSKEKSKPSGMAPDESPQQPTVQPPNTPTNQVKTAFDRELELAKIEAVKQGFQSYFKIGSSILTGGLTALLVLILTLYFSHTLDLLTAVLEGLSIGIVFGFCLRLTNRRYMNFLKKYDYWIIKIKEETPLPTVVEMTKEV
jgi:hypothetical protein